MLFRREPFLCFFLFAIQKERRKPSAPCRGRHPGRGAAGLLVTNGGQPFGAEKPDGPVPGGHTGYPSKTCRWDVFESTEVKALGFVLAGARLVLGYCLQAGASLAGALRAGSWAKIGRNTDSTVWGWDICPSFSLYSGMVRGICPAAFRSSAYQQEPLRSSKRAAISAAWL